MYYGGIDAHLNYLTVAVVDKQGAAVWQGSLSTRIPERIVEALAPFRPLDVVVETCPYWPWIHDLLTPTDVRFHLAHAKKLRAIAASSQKNDQVDALLLARMLLAGLIPEAHPRQAEQRERLRLLRHRAMLVRHRTAAANRIHAQLHQSRLFVPREKLLRRETRGWLAGEAWPRLEPEQQALVEGQLTLIDTLAPMIRSLDRRIKTKARESQAARLLMTIPGIGPYRALLLVTEVEPVTRFPAAEQLTSYAGLAPVTRSSGGHIRHGSIPAGANRWIRGALVSAVPSHVRAAPESGLSRSYEQLKARLGWRVARVATARKLVRVIYAMLRSGQSWRAETPGVGTTAGASSILHMQPGLPL